MKIVHKNPFPTMTHRLIHFYETIGQEYIPEKSLLEIIDDHPGLNARWVTTGKGRMLLPTFEEIRAGIPSDFFQEVQERIEYNERYNIVEPNISDLSDEECRDYMEKCLAEVQDRRRKIDSLSKNSLKVIRNNNIE